MPVASPPSADVRLARIASRQHGLVTIAQLRQVGLGSPGVVAHRVKRGRLHRRYRGVYAVGHGKLSQEGEWMAAVLAAGEGSVLSHLSAAVLWRAWRRRVRGIDVTGRRRELRGVRVHWCRNLDPRDTTRRNGIPVTTVARTLVDLTDVLTKHQLANVIHEAAFRKLFHERATRDAMARANGRRNLLVLEAALKAHAAGSAGTRSGLEDRFLALARAVGLPEPLVNTEVATGIEVDFHWPDRDLCVEIDGDGHSRPRTRREDEARDRALEAAGRRVVRVDNDDLTDENVRALSA